MTFGLDLYLLDYLAVALPISWIIFISDTNATHEGAICHVPFPGQRSRQHVSFDFWRSRRGYSCTIACVFCSNMLFQYQTMNELLLLTLLIIYREQYRGTQEQEPAQIG